MAVEPASVIVGVDVGGTKILAAAVDAEGAIIGRHKRRTKAEKGPEAVLLRLAGAVHGALEAAGLTMDAVEAVGVGIPGPTDSVRGIVHETPNLGIEEMPVGQLLGDTLGVPVFVGNDVNLCTLGEFDLGAGRGARSMIGIFVGTGVGGGLIIDGELYEGATQAAGEIGHMILRVGGARCGCGQRGCMEALASRLAIEREIRAAIESGKTSIITDLLAKKGGAEGEVRRIRSSMLAKAYGTGDRVVRRVVNRSAKLVGIALAGAVHLLNPERVVVGGGVVEALGAAYVEKVERSLRRNSFKISHRELRVVRAELGDDAGVLGAVCLVRRRLRRATSVAGAN